MTANLFVVILRPIIFRFRGSVTSGLRSETRNKKVGGSPVSRHLYDLAKDIVLDNKKSNAAFIKECHRQGLVAIDEGNHVHVQTK